MKVSTLTRYAQILLMAFALSACGGSGGSSSNNDEAGNQEQQGGGEEQQGGGSGGEEGSDSSAMNFTCSAGMENQSNLFKDYVGTYGDIAPDPKTPDYDHTVAVDFDTMTYSVDGGDPVGFNVFGGEIQLMDGATASLNDDGTVVSVDLTGVDGNVKFSLSGTLEGTAFDVTTAKNAKLGLELNGASVTSGNYPAISVSPKTATVFLTLKGVNFLSDSREFGTGYSSANGKNYYDDNAVAADIEVDAEKTVLWAEGSDDNGVLSAKGTLRITGEGTLNVVTGYKHGIYAKNRVYMYGGNIGVYNEGRNGIQSKNGFDMSGGTVLLCGVGEHTNKQSRGIIVSGDESDEGAGLGGINIKDGVIGIITVGKAISAKWDIEDDAETTDTADDPKPVVSISGGIIDIRTTGKVIDSDIYANRIAYYDEDGLAVTEVESSSPEGIEGKLGVDISGGLITVSSTDDALNASRDGDAYVTIRDGNESPYLVLQTSSGDAIDSNGDINLEGGVVVAVSSLGSEDGFDCDGKLNISGGIAVGISGSNHVYASEVSTRQNTFVMSSNYGGKPGTSMAVMNSAGTPVFAFEIPHVITKYGVMTITSPNMISGDTYSIMSGVTLNGGISSGGLYYEMPDVSGGNETGTVNVYAGTYLYSLGAQHEGGNNPGGQGNPPGRF